MIKAYTTFAGAKRAANGGPILRVLDDPHELWIVGHSQYGTVLMDFDPSRERSNASIRYEDLKPD